MGVIMTGIPSDSFPIVQSNKLPNIEKSKKNSKEQKVENIKKNALSNLNYESNKELQTNQNFSSQISTSQKVNKIESNLLGESIESEDLDEPLESEDVFISPNSESASETPSFIEETTAETSNKVQTTYEEGLIEKEPEKEKEQTTKIKNEPYFESKSNLVKKEESFGKEFDVKNYEKISDIETIKYLLDKSVLNSLLIYEGNAFRETTILAEANVVVLREKETDKFNVIINHNCNREEVQTAFQEQAQNFGVNPQKVTYYQVANGEMWSHFQAELTLRFPQLAPQQTSSKDDSSSVTQEEIRNQGRKEGPQKTKTKQKIPKEITQQATLAALKNSVRKSLSSYKEFSDQKAEERRRVENDVLKWTLRAYDRAKEDITKEIKKGEVNIERLKKRAPLWADSLPPFPIIVRTNPQLYRGELKAKTLEQIAVLLERQNREGMR